MGHWIRRLVSIGVLAALVAPAVFDHDDFPLATYPMYARSRGDVVAVATANGVTSDGGVLRLSLDAIGDSDDPLIVEALVRDAVRSGTDETDALCQDIAARVSAGRSDIDRISIVTETHNVVDHASGPTVVAVAPGAHQLSGNAVRNLAARIDRWLVTPAPPERLAMFRILLGAFTFLYLLVRLPVFLALADGRPSRFEGVGLLSMLDEPLPRWLLTATVIIALFSAPAFCVGWRYRVSGPALALSMLLLATYRSSWGQLLHFENLMVLHLVVLALSPGADAWSVDARSVDLPGDRTRRPKSSRYGWPLQLAAVITVVTYVLAGFAKLRYGGGEWLFGDTLRNHIAYSATRLDLLGGDASPLAGLVVARRWLFPPLAIATVVIELAAPLALSSTRWRRWWVVSAWLMHVGILGLMFIVFPYPLFGLAFAPMYQVERVVDVKLPFRGGSRNARRV